MSNDAEDFFERVYGIKPPERLLTDLKIKRKSKLEMDCEELSALFSSHHITANELLRLLIIAHPEVDIRKLLDYAEWAMSGMKDDPESPFKNFSMYFPRNINELQVSLDPQNRRRASGNRRRI